MNSKRRVEMERLKGRQRLENLAIIATASLAWLAVGITLLAKHHADYRITPIAIMFVVAAVILPLVLWTGLRRGRIRFTAVSTKNRVFLGLGIAVSIGLGLMTPTIIGIFA